MTNYTNNRQANNLEAIHKQIPWLHQQPDGIIFQQQISGNNCMAINKFKSLL